MVCSEDAGISQTGVTSQKIVDVQQEKAETKRVAGFQIDNRVSSVLLSLEPQASSRGMAATMKSRLVPKWNGLRLTHEDLSGRVGLSVGHLAHYVIHPQLDFHSALQAAVVVKMQEQLPTKSDF